MTFHDMSTHHVYITMTTDDICHPRVFHNLATHEVVDQTLDATVSHL